MTDPVLTDAEKNALLDGVSSGAIEVHSGAGQKYAEVNEFEFAARARIRKNSYPRLQILNQQLANRVANYCGSVLNCKVAIKADPVSNQSYGDQCGRFPEPSVVTIFSAPPLEGCGLLVQESAAISQLVEAFFGGAGNDVITNSSGSFSPGELAVCRLFSNAILSTLRDVWEPIIEVEPNQDSTGIGTALVEGIGDSDAVIGSRFALQFDDVATAFTLLLPVAMIGHLIPVFDGQKRDRDAVEDRRWEQAIRKRLPDIAVRLDATVGKARMPLGAVAGLRPGEIVDIRNPQQAIIAAGEVPVLMGRYGVHVGRNAIETTNWIATQ